MKKNEIIYISPVEGESVHDAVEEYNELITKVEENLLVDLVKTYKSDKGEIDTNYVRLISVLRRNGLAYPQIKEMIDFCMDSGCKINNDKLNAVTELKKSGALGVDISGILSACRTDNQGKYNQDDIKAACDLSSAVIGGEEVSALLENVRNNNDAKEFFMYFSQFFEDKSYLLKLAELIKDKDNISSLNKMEILYNLSQNNFKDEKSFIKDASDIIKTAQNGNETFVDDDAAGICAIMCQNNMSIEDIKTGLNLCKDSNGKTDNDLSELLWNLCLKKANILQIQKIISQCKDSQGNIDHKFTQIILKKLNNANA